MNIEHLSDHIQFNDIFSSCLNKKGRVDWYKVVLMPNLPYELVDKYFSVLKPLNIELYQNLDERIIQKYKEKINWYIVIKKQKLSQECIDNCIDMIKKLNIWSLLFRHQKLSYEFLLKHLDKIKENENYMNNITLNADIDDSIKNKIQSLL